MNWLKRISRRREPITPPVTSARQLNCGAIQVTPRREPVAVRPSIATVEQYRPRTPVDHPRCPGCGVWVTALGIYDYCGRCDATTEWYV